MLGPSTVASTGNFFDPAEHITAKMGEGSTTLAHAETRGHGWYGPYNGGATTGTLTGREVYQLDVVIDDGLPYQGGLVVVYGAPTDADTAFGNYFAGSVATNANCVAAGTYSPTSTNAYALNSDERECLFWLRANY